MDLISWGMHNVQWMLLCCCFCMTCPTQLALPTRDRYIWLALASKQAKLNVVQLATGVCVHSVDSSDHQRRSYYYILPIIILYMYTCIYRRSSLLVVYSTVPAGLAGVVRVPFADLDVYFDPVCHKLFCFHMQHRSSTSMHVSIQGLHLIEPVQACMIALHAHSSSDRAHHC